MYSVDNRAKWIRKFVQALPCRKSQATNWALKFLPVKNKFIGDYLDKKMEVHPFEASSRSCYFLGYYERETTIWVLDYIKKEKPKLIFDVGANFGYFYYLSTTSGNAPTIHAFEPDKSNLEWLRNNIRLNNAETTVKVIEKAISSQKGSLTFTPSSTQADQNLWARLDYSEKSEGNVVVDTITLDDYCVEHDIREVDLLKIDIEGGEGFAVEGMKECLKNRVFKKVLLEIHPTLLPESQKPEQIINTFLNNGYEVHHFNSDLQKFNDKNKETYDFQWKSEYLSKYDPNKPITGWEHFLFVTH